MAQVNPIEDTESDDRFLIWSSTGQQLVKVHSGLDSFGALVTGLFYLLLQRRGPWIQPLNGLDVSTASYERQPIRIVLNPPPKWRDGFGGGGGWLVGGILEESRGWV